MYLFSARSQRVGKERSSAPEALILRPLTMYNMRPAGRRAAAACMWCLPSALRKPTVVSTDLAYLRKRHRYILICLLCVGIILTPYTKHLQIVALGPKL